jgi:hypothetical protein
MNESASPLNAPHKLVKSKKRVADHGEVFTPEWLVEDMLDTVAHESDRIDSRFLESACGSGNFLVKILRRKLVTVQKKFGRSEFERRHHALFGLMCIYGIEILQDNAAECRANLVEIFLAYIGDPAEQDWFRAAIAVTEANIVQGDALSMLSVSGDPIVFPEWAYLTKGKFSRRDFSYDSLTQRASFKGTLFEDMADHDIFIPTHEYSQLTMRDIARFSSEASFKGVS